MPHIVTIDRESVLRWAQTTQPPLMRESGALGAGLSVVTADDVLLLRGFGRTEAEGQAIDPAAAAFRIGSVTKLMTALLAVRLAAAGRIDLDADINTLLRRVHVPATQSGVVTLRQILRHRAGFAGVSMRLQVDSFAQTQMSAAAMQRHIRRVRPAGDVPAYDNLGYGLLGIALEDATETDLAALYRDMLFAPLGMENAFLGIPPGREPRMARGHVFRGDAIRAIKPGHLFSLVQAAGAVSATAHDMAKFAQCLLRHGAPLLGEDEFSAMLQFQALHPEAPGIGVGFLESDFAGRRAFGHGGLIDGFTSRLAVFPQAGVALFVAFNTGPNLRRPPWLAPFDRLRNSPEAARRQAAASVLDRRVTESFADRFIPAPLPQTTPPLASIDTAKLGGIYKPTRARSGNFLDRVTHPGIGVSAMPDGRLRIGGKDHTRLSGGHFADAGGSHAWFRLDGNRALMAQSATAIYERDA